MNRPPIDQQVTFLYSWDLEKSARFYGQTLGLEMVLDQGGVPTRVEVWNPGAQDQTIFICHPRA